MITIGGADTFTNALERSINKLKAFDKVSSDEKLLIKNNVNTVKNWSKTVLPEIVNTSGQNIGYPFRSKKGGKPADAYRQFNVPFSWVLGVWSGATYYSLMNMKAVSYTSKNGVRHSRDIINEVTGNSIKIGFKAYKDGEDVTNDLNFSIGVTDEFLQKRADATAELFKREMQKILGDI